MKLLSLSTIKQIELELTQRYPLHQQHHNLKTIFSGFKPFIPSKKHTELHRLGVEECLTLQPTQLAPLQAFSWALLRIIFSQEVQQDVLTLLKSIVYGSEATPLMSEDLSLTQSSAQYSMAVMVDMFQSLEYSCINGKVEINLLKDSLKMDLMVFYLSRLHRSINQNENTVAGEIFQDLIDYFDLNCRRQKQLFLFHQEQIFLLIIDNQQIVFGQYSPNKKTRLNRSIMKQSIEIGKIQYPRSVGIQQISDSVIFEVDAGTPSFKFDDSEASFNSSVISEGSNMKSSRQVNQRFNNLNLLKEQDKVNNMKKSLGIFGSLADNKRKWSLQRKVAYVHTGFDKIIDTPKTTYNTPKTVHQSLFLEINRPIQMNRSQFFDPRKSQSLKDIILREEKIKEEGFLSCICHAKKKQKNRLNSNIYDINVSVVVEGNYKSVRKQNTKIQVMSKGINFEIFCKSSQKLQPRKFPKTISSRQLTPHNISTRSISHSNSVKKIERSINTLKTTSSPLRVPAFLKKKKKEQERPI